jgi:Spy/CpxP family protein refolding chaperone
MRAITLSTILMVIASATAQAQTGQGMGGGTGMALDDAGYNPTIPMLTTMLSLTPDQARQLVPWRDTLLMNTKASRREALSARAAMQQARRSGASADSLAVLRQRMQVIMVGMMPARMQFHAQVRSILTPDQVTVFDAHQRDIMSTMEQRMQGDEPSTP